MSALNFQIFSKENQPTEAEIRDFVGLDFFVDLDSHLRESYKIKPKFSYSNCAMDKNIWRGWNMKYIKSGKTLCTIYPQQERFMVLVPGKGFEVKTKDDIGDILLALETRAWEIGLKK